MSERRGPAGAPHAVRFGASAPFTVGLEEELMLLDRDTLAPVPVAAAVIADAGAEGVGGVKQELFAAVLETNTTPRRTAVEALADLSSLRRQTARLAARQGAVVAAIAAHPFSPSEEQAFSGDERYRPMIEFGGPVTQRQNVCGLHVHVGMPTSEACFRAVESTLPWLPLVLAVSANSPWLAGRPNGLLSNRAEALSLLYRNGAPPAFRSYAEWEAYAERLRHAGVIDGYTRLWWDIRPHPHYGTVEVRMPDQPTSARRAGAVAALVQALCATSAEGPDPQCDPGRRGDYVENRWRALRFGPRAELVHPEGDRLVPAPALLAELLERVAPAAARLGGEELLAELEPGRCEADEQLAAGDARAAAAWAVERSVPSPP